MGENKTLYLGIELANEFTQVSFYQAQTNEALSITMGMDVTNPLVPTCLFIKESTKEWTFGEDAVRLQGQEEGLYIDYLVSKIVQDESVQVYQTVYTPTMLISKYFKKVLGYIRQHYLNTSIAKIVITLEDTSPKVCDTIYSALHMLGLEKDRVMVLTKVQCFMYYILSQKQELWVNDVGLFQFDENGMYYYRLTVNRNNSPMPVIVDKIDLSKELSQEMLEQEGVIRFTQRFENITNQLLFKRLTTSLFFTGKGFAENWIDNTLKKLCVGRRVFKGQNLYTKGACYAANAIAHNELNDYLLLSDDMITSTISLRLYQDAKEIDYPLVQAGTLWWQVNESITVILDSTKDLEFTVKNLLKREPIKEIFHIDNLMERENKTIRLSIQLHFVDRDSAVITVRDIGFGQFYETTYRIWEQILSL
ncbi:MAG: DUF5716 family protein [Clostridiales bacterium]|nr:DUF5716 family protein [Clostridiales bacterium]